MPKLIPVEGGWNAVGAATGTYIGSGAATAAIVSTGLVTIQKVWMQRNVSAYSAATADIGSMPRPCLAAGTTGSFYPTIGFIDKGAAVNHTLGVGPAAATWHWLAVGL